MHYEEIDRILYSMNEKGINKAERIAIEYMKNNYSAKIMEMDKNGLQ